MRAIAPSTKRGMATTTSPLAEASRSLEIPIGVADQGPEEDDEERDHWVTNPDTDGYYEFLWHPGTSGLEPSWKRRLPTPRDLAAIIAEVGEFREVWLGATDVQASFHMLRSLATLAGVPPLDGNEVRVVLAQLVGEAFSRELGDQVAGCDASVVARDTVIELRLQAQQLSHDGFQGIAPPMPEGVGGPASPDFLARVEAHLSDMLSRDTVPSSAPRATRRSTFARLFALAGELACRRRQPDRPSASEAMSRDLLPTPSCSSNSDTVGPSLGLRTIHRVDGMTCEERGESLRIIAESVRKTHRLEMDSPDANSAIFVAVLGDLRYAPQNPMLASIAMAEYTDVVDSIASGCRACGRMLHSVELRGTRGCSVKLQHDWAWRTKL